MLWSSTCGASRLVPTYVLSLARHGGTVSREALRAVSNRPATKVRTSVQQSTHPGVTLMYIVHPTPPPQPAMTPHQRTGHSQLRSFTYAAVSFVLGGPTQNRGQAVGGLTWLDRLASQNQLGSSRVGRNLQLVICIKLEVPTRVCESAACSAKHKDPFVVLPMLSMRQNHEDLIGYTQRAVCTNDLSNNY